MIEQINWEKVDGLIPAIIQDQNSGQVLMLGYMNEEALQATQASGFVTFFSRTKRRLWTKGETSGNKLELVEITLDCDQDTLLIRVNPRGPVCHKGPQTCFDDTFANPFQRLQQLEQTIQTRKQTPVPGSYTAKLFAKGRDKIAQKVGEEGVEVVIAAKNDNQSEFLGECADLIYHLTVLIADRDCHWSDVLNELAEREK